MALRSEETKQLCATVDAKPHRKWLSGVHRSTGQQTQLWAPAHTRIRQIGQMVREMCKTFMSNWRNLPWSGLKHHLSTVVKPPKHVYDCIQKKRWWKMENFLPQRWAWSPHGDNTCIIFHKSLKHLQSKPPSSNLDSIFFLLDIVPLRWLIWTFTEKRLHITLQPVDVQTGVRCLLVGVAGVQTKIMTVLLHWCLHVPVRRWFTNGESHHLRSLIVLPLVRANMKEVSDKGHKSQTIIVFSFALYLHRRAINTVIFTSISGWSSKALVQSSYYLATV